MNGHLTNRVCGCVGGNQGKQTGYSLTARTRAGYIGVSSNYNLSRLLSSMMTWHTSPEPDSIPIPILPTHGLGRALAGGNQTPGTECFQSLSSPGRLERIRRSARLKRAAVTGVQHAPLWLFTPRLPPLNSRLSCVLPWTLAPSAVCRLLAEFRCRSKQSRADPLRFF